MGKMYLVTFARIDMFICSAVQDVEGGSWVSVRLDDEVIMVPDGTTPLEAWLARERDMRSEVMEIIFSYTCSNWDGMFDHELRAERNKYAALQAGYQRQLNLVAAWDGGPSNLDWEEEEVSHEA